MKIRTFTKCIFLCLLTLIVTFKISAKSFPESRGSHKIPEYENGNNFYVDRDVINFPSFSCVNKAVFQLISHGRPGELWLNGRWRNAVEIAWFIRSDHLLSSSISHINIYGCSFGKGKVGGDAIVYLEKSLHVSISASDDVTGKNGDWNLEIGAQEDVLHFPGFSGNLQYAASDDLDGDGIINSIDIDDDNDGILDAIEAPVCYYTQAEAADIVAVSSDLTFTDVKENAIDENIASIATLTNAQAIANKVIYQIQFNKPLRLSQLVDSLSSTTGIVAAGATYRIEASNASSGPWTDVSGVLTAPATPGTGNHMVWTLTATQPYLYYRIVGISGNTANGGSREFIASGIVNYAASANPKATCAKDADNDGITNDKDLDSDGDGCPDALEAGVYNQAGVTAIAGSVKNGSGGAVTSTTNTPNAVISGTYGSNGFADMLESSTDIFLY